MEEIHLGFFMGKTSQPIEPCRSAIPVKNLTLEIINESWLSEKSLAYSKNGDQQTNLSNQQNQDVPRYHHISKHPFIPHPILVPIRTFWRSGVATGTTSSTFWSGAVGLLNSYKLSRFQVILARYK